MSIVAVGINKWKSILIVDDASLTNGTRVYGHTCQVCAKGMTNSKKIFSLVCWHLIEVCAAVLVHNLSGADSSSASIGSRVLSSSNFFAIAKSFSLRSIVSLKVFKTTMESGTASIAAVILCLVLTRRSFSANKAFCAFLSFSRSSD